MLLADDVSTGTIMGTGAIVLTSLVGLATVWLNNKANVEKLKLEFRVQELEKSEKLCQQTIEQLRQEIRTGGRPSLAGFYVWAGWDEVILNVTDGVRDVLGYRPSDLIGQHVSVLMIDAVKAAHHGAFEAARQTGNMRNPDLAIRSQARAKDGTPVDVTVSIEPVQFRGRPVLRAEVSRRGQLAE